MFVLPMKNPILPLFGLVALLILCGIPAQADTNAVFVSFLGSQSNTNTVNLITIPVQGNGWNYSAAAQFAGSKWNQVLKPNPAVPDGTANGGTLGTFNMGCPSNNILNNPDGNATAITLSGTITIGAIDSSTNRFEPNSGSWASNALSPVGLGDNGWRIYKSQNIMNLKLANLSANANYLLFVYGAYVSGAAYAGCYIGITNPSNVLTGGVNYLDIPGSATGYVFTNNSGNISPVAGAPAGVSNAASQYPWGVIPVKSDANGNLTFSSTRPGYNFATNSTANSAIGGSGGSWINGFQLVPYPLPTITSQPPAAPSATVGSAASLSIKATNWYTNSFTYQWQKGGVNLSDGSTGNGGSSYSGTTNAVLSISNAQPGDAGNFSCVVSNVGGAVTSTVSALGITQSLIAPSIASQPANVSVGVGISTNLTVSANGSAPLTYQWQVSTDNGATYTSITGATNASLSFASPSLSDSGLYQVIVTNGAGSITSSAATLTVTEVAISTQPVGGLFSTGSSQTLSVTVAANPPPAYQWQRSLDGYTFTNIGSGTNSSLTLTIAATNSGFYRVVATNSVGSVTSSVVLASVASTNLGAPTLSPSNNAVSVNRDTPLRLTFSSPPVVGSAGTIRVYDATNDALVASYDLGSMNIGQGTTTTGTSYGVYHYTTRTINGDSVTYTPIISLGTQPAPSHLPWTPSYSSNTALIYLPASTTLSYGKTYYVQMDAGVFVDSNGAAFSGISDKNTWHFSTKSSGPSLGSTNISIGNDGSVTDFSTVQGAADFVPSNNLSPTTVTLRSGLYFEDVHWKSPNVTLQGQGRTNTAIAWLNNNNINPSTASRPVMDVVASNVTLQDLAVYNLTPYGGSQAEALYTGGQQITLNRVGLYSYQDTFLPNTGSAFVTDSYIEGATDYIWGTASAYFERCELKANTNGAYYTQARNSQNGRGFSFVNCTLDAYPGVTNNSATLSRTFGSTAPFSQTAYVNCRMGPHIQPIGWYVYNTTNTNATLQLWEYQSRDLSNNLIDVSQRATFNRSFSVNGTNIVYSAGQSSSLDVLTNNQISSALATLMTNWSNQLGGWTPVMAIADPVVTPKIATAIYVYQGSTYADSGATLLDPAGNNTVAFAGSGSVDTTTIGSYTITYPGYTNALGVSFLSTPRTVTVVPVPALVLNGSNPLSVNWGSTFSDPGATLNDPMDGTITVSAAVPPDTSKLGSTTLTYAYTNSLGNVVTPIQRIVNVVPVTPNLPNIGSNSYDITVPNASINGGVVASTTNASSVNASAINAFIAYCSTNGGGTIQIPAGTFVSDTITLRSNVNLQLASNAVLKNSNYNNTLVTTTGSPSDIAITGSGAIDGGATTTVGANNLVVLTSCTRLLIQGVTIKNSGHEHLVIQYGNHVTVDGVTVTDVNTLAANGGAYLANTDGIDYYGQNFLFKNCKVDAGDDDIVAKPLGSACVNITITNCTIGAGHGIGVGGGTKLGLTNYLVTDCSLTGTDYGVRIKAGDNPTNNPGGIVSNVVYRNIAMTNVARPLVLESWYDSGDNFPSSPTDYSVYTTKYSSNNTFYTTNARATDAYTPMFMNISYLNITVTNCMYPGDFEGMYTTPRNINGLTFSNVTVSVATNASSSSQFNLWHATNVTISNLKVTTSPRNAYYNASPLKGVWTNDLGNLVLVSNTVTPATVTITNTNQTYDGTAKAVMTAVSPTAAAPLSVTYSNLSYAVSTNPPTNAGAYIVVGLVTNSAYSGSSTATLTISPATALVNFSNTNQPYNGYARTVVVSTTPGNLLTTLTYAGSSNAPIGVGSYPLQSSVINSNYSGSASATLVIYDPVAVWRQSLFGTSSNSGNAADTASPFGIGLNNLQAYTFGINPTQPFTNPLLSISNAGSNTVTLSFLARAAGSDIGYAGLTRYYNLESTTNLTNSSWISVAGYTNLPASNQTIIFSTNTSSATKFFYRLKAWLQ